MSIRRCNVLEASSFKLLTVLGGAFALLVAPTLARAEGGGFTLTFTRARPIADAGGWCGETENYVRIYKVLDNDTGQYDPNWLAESDYMRVHDCTFGGSGCTPDPRPIEPPISVSVQRELGNTTARYIMALFDKPGGLCGGGLLDMVPGPHDAVLLDVDYVTGAFSMPSLPGVTPNSAGEFCVTNTDWLPNGNVGACWVPTVETIGAIPAECQADPATCPSRFRVGVAETSPGIFFAELDNPRPLVSFLMRPGEEAQVSGGLSTFLAFDLALSVTPGVPVGSTPDPNSSPAVVGSVNQTYTVSRIPNGPPSESYVAGQEGHFESLGVQLGHDPSILQWTKTGLSPSEASPAQTWRLRDDVIVVPVDVVEAVVAGETPVIGPEAARVLFDDKQNVPTQATPGASPAEARRESNPSASPSLGSPALAAGQISLFRNVAGITRPDDIFAQCGIQFRMRSYTPVTVSEGAYELGGRTFAVDAEPRPGEPHKCVSAEWTFPRPAGSGSGRPEASCFVAWENLAAGDQQCIEDQQRETGSALHWKANELQPFAAGGVRAIFTHVIGGGFDINCNSLRSDSGLADINDDWAGVSLERSLFGPTTLAHEIGHVLATANDSGHTNLAGSLMVASGDGTDIFGCHTWRTDGTRPLNCTKEVESTSDSSCAHMRTKAALLAGMGAPTSPKLIMDPPASPGPAPEAQSWTYGRPSYGAVTPVTYLGQAVEGTASIVAPLGYRDIASAPFETTELGVVGSQAKLQVYVPANVPNPWWVGSVALTFENVATNTNTYLGQVDLTPLPRGAWSLVTFTLPANVQAVLLGDHPAAEFIVTTNTSVTGVLLDAFGFNAPFTPRTVFHRVGSEGLAVATNPLLDFDHASDWVSLASLTAEAAQVSHGAAALGVQASGWTFVSSSLFATSTLPSVTNHVGLDVYIPSPQPNPWWTGEVALYTTCSGASVYNAFLGNVPLQNLFVNEYNHLTFALPAEVKVAFQSSTSCKFDVVLNVSNGAGRFLLDRLGFE